MTCPKRKSGFILVFALMLTVLISMISMSLFAIQGSRYSSSKAALERAQCRAIARAGMDNAEIKISKDPFFPSGVGDNQVVFSYSEELISVRSDRRVGSFVVTVDRTDEKTLRVVRVESVGTLGADSAKNAPRFTIYGELSVDPENYGFKVWQEGGLPKL